MTSQSGEKSYTDRKHRHLAFEVGDHVFLKVSPRRGLMRFGHNGKLSSRYIGSFDVINKIVEVAYRLVLPLQLSGVHDVFYVSMLQKYEPDPTYMLEWSEFDLEANVFYENKADMVLYHCK